MPLQAYCRDKRLVALKPNASAYDAARALESNHIGAIVVEDEGQVVGIVTDRDLALRVTGSGVDPMSTPLSDVMSPDPVTLSVDESEDRAIQVMRDEHVRRVPIRDGDEVAGIVTLDDLILAGKVDSRRAAEIVEAQLAEPTDKKPAGATHPVRHAHANADERHAAHTQQTLRQFTERLERELGLKDDLLALGVFEIVAAAIMRRLTPAEAQDFAAQLPFEIRERLLDLPAGPDKNVTRESITRDVVGRLGVEPGQAWRLVENVGAAMADLVSPGEIADVVDQLPSDLKPIFDR